MAEADFTIRRARPADREELLSVLGRAFAGADEPALDFLRIQPHLFGDGRIGDHLIRVEDGRIVGCVGLYPFAMRAGGVEFRVAGVGQVATLHEERGRGVMASLMDEACREIAAAGYDLVWLGGDRQRYGRFGWATGGAMLRFDLTARYLPEPPPAEEVRALDAESGFEPVRRHVETSADTVAPGDDEIRLVLRRGHAGGWARGDAYLWYHGGGGVIVAGDGPPGGIALLFAHHLRWLQAQPGERHGFSVQCAEAPSGLLAACHRCYRHMAVEPSGMFRVGALRPFFEKACRAARPRITCGSGEVGLADADTGEGVTVLCQDGELTAEEGAGAGAHRLSRRELSEVCFGLCPPDLLLPGLPADSFFRRVVPLRVHWARIFGV